MDTFPYDSWEEALAAAQEAGEGFFTFGPGGNTATVILTILGVLAMVATVLAFVFTEKRNLEEHVERIRNEGMIGNG
ncbi:MAG: hypothetical protein ACR2QK_25315 [Acidimicrobiales bacterium]